MFASMPSVRFASTQGRFLQIDVPSGTSLLVAATSVGLPIARACGQNRVCARCAVEVRHGQQSLSPEDAREARTKNRNGLGAGTRLACCAEIGGDVEIAASYW
jgi:ferredoxin